MFTQYNPVKVVFGSGTVENIGSLVREHGGAALIVTGQSSMKKTGVLDRVVASLDETGVESMVFDKVEPNPSFPTVDAGAEQAKECDLVIGLGGGSAMDAAKAIAIAAANNRPIADFYNGEEPLRTMPIFAIASTAGTGSEVDRYFVLTNPKTKGKHGWGHPSTYPEAAIVDPAVMATMPPRLTASTGLDAFFHALEAYISLKATPMSDLYAREALRRIIDDLPVAYRHGDDMDARSSMALA
ncbi:MAG: iron-containing alcohol dehydrogenase, partial [Thermoplasmatota archaeon]